MANLNCVTCSENIELDENNRIIIYRDNPNYSFKLNGQTYVFCNYCLKTYLANYLVNNNFISYDYVKEHVNEINVTYEYRNNSLVYCDICKNNHPITDNNYYRLTIGEYCFNICESISMKIIFRDVVMEWTRENFESSYNTVMNYFNTNFLNSFLYNDICSFPFMYELKEGKPNLNIELCSDNSTCVFCNNTMHVNTKKYPSYSIELLGYKYNFCNTCLRKLLVNYLIQQNIIENTTYSLDKITLTMEDRNNKEVICDICNQPINESYYFKLSIIKGSLNRTFINICPNYCLNTLVYDACSAVIRSSLIEIYNSFTSGNLATFFRKNPKNSIFTVNLNDLANNEN